MCFAHGSEEGGCRCAARANTACMLPFSCPQARAQRSPRTRCEPCTSAVLPPPHPPPLVRAPPTAAILLLFRDVAVCNVHACAREHSAMMRRGAYRPVVYPPPPPGPIARCWGAAPVPTPARACEAGAEAPDCGEPAGRKGPSAPSEQALRMRAKQGPMKSATLPSHAARALSPHCAGSHMTQACAAQAVLA